MIRGSLDTLPTPANKKKLHSDHKAVCPRCGRGRVDLKHILNDCITSNEG
jgi:hypothetical protein